MILDIQNCGGIRLIPYGSTTPETFWWGDWSENFACGNLLSYVMSRQNHNSVWYQGYSPRVLMPGFRDAALPLIDIGGTVFLDGLNILDDSPSSIGTVLPGGGYLGIKTVIVKFSADYTGSHPTSDEVSFRALGVIPAQFSGGIRISGLTSPSSTLSNVADPTPESGITPVESARFYGEYKRSYSTIMRLNGRRVYCLNEWALNHTGGNWMQNGRWRVDGFGAQEHPYCYCSCAAGGILGNGVFANANYLYPIYDED